MAEILTPGPFSSLLANPEDLRHVEETLERIIFDSFAVDAQRDGVAPRITKSETRRRFLICEKWFRALRVEFGWSLIRVLDQLEMFLRAELDGRTIDPSRLLGLWAVPNSDRPMLVDPAGRDYTREIAEDDDAG